MEFGKRMAVERDLEKSDQAMLGNLVFDESGHFLLFGTLLGIKGMTDPVLKRQILGTSGTAMAGWNARLVGKASAGDSKANRVNGVRGEDNSMASSYHLNLLVTSDKIFHHPTPKIIM